MAGSGGTHLRSQHLGGRGRQISEFLASLIFRVSSRTARALYRNLVSKNQKKKKTNQKQKQNQKTQTKNNIKYTEQRKSIENRKSHPLKGTD